MAIYKVALEVPLDRLFDYFSQEGVSADTGCRVVVPFGPRTRVGVIVDVVAESDIDPKKLKPAGHVLREMPALTSEWFGLMQFCADYYHAPIGEVMFAALPAQLKTATGYLPRRVMPTYRLTETGRALKEDALAPRAQVARRVLQALQAGFLSHAALRELSERGPAVIKEFIAKGWVEAASVDSAMAHSPEFVAQYALTPEQQSAFDTVLPAFGSFQSFLLHGITGSGKTEVYLRLIAEAIKRNEQALLLVPEINLTPQLEASIAARFPGAAIVSLHSGLNDTERAAHFIAAQTGQAQIVVGTRLAIFTPLPRLGLIVVDEEHDTSYKQQEGMRYSARDVAVFRAKQHNVPIVLGSATPSLETYARAKTGGRHALIELKARAIESAALPAIRTVNTHGEVMDEGLSKNLLHAIRARLDRREQSLIFLNRRGYAPVLACGACGWISGCKRCTSRLTVHLSEGLLRCHHCGFEERIPRSCPTCGNQDIRPYGRGTQRLEAALNRLFPEARVLRVDRDSTRAKHAWAEMRDRIQDDEVDILIGTQMLAKGHDFPRLTLVGVLNSDAALFSADFRATERTFAQLVQVSGRAGRAEIPGEVLIQTELPDHPLYRAVLSHNYPDFANTLLEERKQAGFPPYMHQALLRAEAPELSAALAFLNNAVTLASEPDGIFVYDPVPMVLTRRANMERAQLLVESASRKALQVFLRVWNAQLMTKPDRAVRWHIDVDPLEV